MQLPDAGVLASTTNAVLACDMQFQPQRKVMAMQLIAALLIPLLPLAMLAVPLVMIGKGLPVVPIIAGVYAAIAGLRILYILIHFPTIRYEINAQNITNAEGRYWRVKRTTPVDKITNVDVRQGPLDRLLGVGQVWLYTPSTGSLMPEAKLIGVDDPHAIRTEILALAEEAKSVAGGSHGGDASVANLQQRSTEALLEEMALTLVRIETHLKTSRVP